MTRNFEEFKDKWNPTTIKDNQQRVQLYADLELIKSNESSLRSNSTAILNEMDSISSELALQTQSSGIKRWYHKFEDYVRNFGAILTMIVLCNLMVIPCMLFMFIDYCLVDVLHIVPTCFKLNLITKRFIGHFLLLITGVFLVIEDQRTNLPSELAKPVGFNIYRFWRQWYLNSQSFQGPHQSNVNGLICFTHTSALDAFILCAVVPLQSYTYGKSDLFMIPFFGWLSAIFGGISINRGSQSSAIKSLKSVNGRCRRCTGSGNIHDIKLHDVAVAIAPEGTRSVTGQLLGFKKGPFYLWEHLKCPPIIPFLVMGAYDLMPPPAALKKGTAVAGSTGPGSSSGSGGGSSSLFKSGRVYVRLLPAVTIEEVDDFGLLQRAVSDYDMSHFGNNNNSASNEELTQQAPLMSSYQNGGLGGNNNSSSSLGLGGSSSSHGSRGGSPSSCGVAGDSDVASEGPSCDLRSKVSNQLRRNILTSFRDSYPADAGAPLTGRESILHRLTLYGALLFDFWVIRYFTYELGIQWLGLSYLGVFNYFLLFTVVVTAIVYVVKVKIPQYLY